MFIYFHLGIYRQAESAFLRMVHLGPPSMYGVEKKIFRIDYIKNPELERIFEETKEEFRLAEIPTDEQVLRFIFTFTKRPVL